MISPQEMRARVRRVYERRRGAWVEELIALRLSPKASAAGDGEAFGASAGAAELSSAFLEVNLQPPTRREVLEDIDRVGRWVSLWQEFEGAGEVAWEERRWASVGTQRIPVRVRLGDAESIARVAGRIGEWRLLVDRACDLAQLAAMGGGEPSPFSCEGPPLENLPAAARRLTPTMAAMSQDDWETALAVLRWLGSHRHLSCYIRELPIRGIDTKWIEGHRKLVVGLAKALYGLSELPFRKPPELIRVRALGKGILPEGFEDASLTASELSALRVRPVRAVVCENLISLLTMPAMEGTLALFGSGYGAGSRLAIPWLSEVELYYWGDLDTHGFRILDGFRKHHPHALSVLMDEQTLLAFQDLWVVEPEPFTGELARLTRAEAQVFDFLRQQAPPPRLEQERIPYDHVKAAFERIVSSSLRR